jgi:hypothetical protein
LTQSQTNAAVGIEKNSDAKRLINLVSIGPPWPRFLAMIYEHSLCITPASMRGYEMEAKPQCSRRRRAWPCYVLINVINLSPGEGKIHPQRGLCVVLSQQHRNNIAAVRAS